MKISTLLIIVFMMTGCANEMSPKKINFKKLDMRKDCKDSNKNETLADLLCKKN